VAPETGDARLPTVERRTGGHILNFSRGPEWKPYAEYTKQTKKIVQRKLDYRPPREAERALVDV